MKNKKFERIPFVLVMTCTLFFATFFAMISSLQAAPLPQGTATCNGTIYRDDNGNGTFDANEPLSPASRVEIYDMTETLLGEAVTDGQGNWTIADLPVTTLIRVQIKGPLPGGLIEGPVGADSNGFVIFTDTGSCADMSFGALLVSACSNLCLEVGNRVWFDENPDGLQNANESGIAGVTVSIYDTGNQLVAQKVTDADGQYYFTCQDGLEPETDYEIRLDNAADYANGGPLFETFLTNAFQGTDPQIDSVGTLSNGVPIYGFTTGEPGQAFHQLDFGFTPPATIGDTVWFDVNANGTQDTYDLAYSDVFTNLQGIDFSGMLLPPQTGVAEVGIPNVTVNIYGAGADNVVGTGDDVLLDTQITDAVGQYRFRPLQPGLPYLVQVDDSTLPGPMTASFDEDGAGDHQIVVSALTAGQQHLTADFGYAGGVDLGIDKQSDFPDWRARDTVVWTVVVTNYGSLPAPNVVVADVMGGPYSSSSGDNSLSDSVDDSREISGFDIILARIFELFWSFDPVTGNYNLVPDVDSQTDAEALIADWIANNVSVDGGPDWTCSFDYNLIFPSGLLPANDESATEKGQTIQDLQLYYLCELNSDLAAGAAAPPITFTIGNEFNFMNHQPDTLNLSDSVFLGQWDQYPARWQGTKETNYVITESLYGAEPFGTHANEDQASIDDIGDLQWDKALANSANAPFDVGEDIIWEITVTNVGSNSWDNGIFLQDSVGYGYITAVPSAPWECDPLLTGTQKDTAIQCFHPALAGGLAPGASVTAQVTTRMNSSAGNTAPITHPENLKNTAQANYMTAIDDDTANNSDSAPYTVFTTAWTLSKGSPVEVNGELQWTINHNVTAAMIPAGQVFIIEERLNQAMPLNSVVANGWQCEAKTAGHPGSCPDCFDQNYNMCWFDPVANPGTIPSLIIRTAFVDGLSNTACPGRGERFGPQDWSFGVNSGACESSPTFGGVPIAPTDMAITKVHDLGTEPWARGSNGTFTLNISELGIGPDRPVVEDVLQYGLTLVDVRNASGVSVIDGNGDPVAGTGWDCTSNIVPSQLQIFQPSTIGFYGGIFQCVRDATLSNASDQLFVDVQVTTDAGDFVHNDAAVEGLTRAEPRKTTANPPLWEVNDLGTVDNYDNDEVPVPSPDLKIEKSHVAPVFAGVAFDFTILVTNNSDFSGIAAGSPVPSPAPLPLPVHVTDTFPLGLDYLGFSGTDWTCTSDGATPPVISCSYGTAGNSLAAGTSASPLTIQAIAPGTSLAATNNAAAVWTDQSPIIFYSQTPDAVTDALIINIPFVEATKTSSLPQALVGDASATFDFMLTIDNSQGNGAAMAPVRITDNISTAFNINSITGADWNCSASSGQLVDCLYSAGDFPQGASSKVTVNVTVDDDTPAGQVGNTMVASHGGIQALTSELTSTRNINVLRYADLSVSKSRDIVEPNPGDILAYTIVITNVGPAGAQDVQVLDYIPYGGSYVDNQGSDPAWTCTSDGGSPELVTCNLANDLPVGNAPALILRMGVTADALPGISNFITIQSSTANTPGFSGQLYAIDEYMATTGCIGDYVWLDPNEDGVEEGTTAGPDGTFDTLDDIFNIIGPGLDGIMSTADDSTHGFNAVELELLWAGLDDVWGTADDVNMGTTQTDPSGYYSFEFIPKGFYTVTVNTATGTLTADSSPFSNYYPTYDLDSGTTVPDNKSAVSVGDTGTNWVRSDIDFGYNINGITGSIGDTIWDDQDSSGGDQTTQGAEPGIPGVVVTLERPGPLAPLTTTTTITGYYLFDNLPLGTYTVTVDTSTLPPGYDPVSTHDGTDGGNDSRSVTTIDETTPDDLNQDFSYVQGAQIGDRVWLEDDGDGDASTGTVTPIAGMVITATSGADTYTAVTDANGYYSITVPAGTYDVTYGPAPASYGALNPSATPGGNSESGNAGTYNEAGNPDSSHAQNTSVTVAAGEANWHVDFAFVPQPAQFGDRVWLEDDGDGNAATGTVTPIAGMTITATNGTDTYTTVTDANGYYSFTVAADTYTVSYGPVPASYGIVAPSATPGGSSETGDAGSYMEGGNPDQSHAQATTVTLVAGQTNWHIDFAFMPEPAQFGDRVWLEDDGDGDAATGTVTPIAGMTITATNGTTTYTAVTDANGYYSFTVPADTYTVSYGPAPASYGSVLPSATPGGNSESGNAGTYNEAGNPDSSHAQNTSVTVAAGEANWHVDFAFVPEPAQFGDRVWLEDDGDGDASTGTVTPIAGMTITATNGTDTHTTVTDANGYYSFTVSADTYTVSYGPAPASYGFVVPSATPGGNSETGDAGSYMEGGNPDQSHAQATTVTMTAGETNWHIDFAFMPQPAQFGDRVWLEDDGDGDAATGTVTPIAGMTITATNGTATYTAVTNPDGYYSFTVPADTYTVTYGAVPAIYGPVLPSLMPGGNSESGNAGSYMEGGNPDQSHAQATTVTVAAAEENWHIDFAFSPEVSLGSTLFNDGDNNGLLDSGETGIPNITVELYTSAGTLVMTTTTDVNGDYFFDRLLPGDYQVIVPTPPTDAPMSSTTTNLNDDNVDGDDNGDQPGGAGTSVSSPIIRLTADQEPTGESGTGGSQDTADDNNGDMTVDFGFISYDYGDAPDSYGTNAASNGAKHLMDGITFLGSRVDPEGDGQPTTNADGDDNNLDDDEDGITFLTPIMAGQPFTIAAEASASGYLNTWIDFDGNGTFDAGEQISTDQPLITGTNTLRFTAPASVDDDNLYSRFRFTANSGEVTTPHGRATTGEVEDYVLMSLGDTVWLDNDNANNGIKDGIEAGVPGVTVELYAQGTTPGVDAPAATTVTDGNGEYLFTGLVPDDYIVHLPASNFADGAPLEDHFSSSDPGGTAVDPDNNQDGDDNGIGGGTDTPSNDGITTLPVTLALGTEPIDDGNGSQSNRTMDFGLVQYDKGDLPDINVGAAPGDYETLTTMGHDGARHIIVPGVYLGAGVDAEADGQPNVDANGDDSSDSPGDSDDEDGVVFTSMLLPNQKATVDVTANVNGYLNAWIDFNGDGDFADADEQIATDTALTAGVNSLVFVVPNIALAPDLYTRFRFTSDDPAGQLGADGSWGNGEVEDYLLRGLSLGNQVWHDLDDDGIRDVAEPAIDGVVVNLVDPANGAVIKSTTTANGGYYIFDNLMGQADHQAVSGEYIVEIAAANFQPGGPLEGMYNSNPTEADPNADIDLNDNGLNPAINSQPPTTTIQSGVITLSDAGEPTQETEFGPEGHGSAANESSNLTVDFGFYLPVTVGDMVWFDNDQDGLQEAGEAGVTGVDVTLYNSITGQPMLDSAGNPMMDMTDVNGNYLFAELPPGRYHVQFDLNDLPQNYIVTTPHVGSDISMDSNANPSLGVTDSTPFLYSKAEDLTLDMGIMLLEDVRVGDRVWFDDNKDGIQDIGETGVPSVTVTLHDNGTGQPIVDGSGNPLIAVTDIGGNYLFTELPPGDYYVQFDLNTLPQNYLPTVSDAGGDDEADSDGDPNTGITLPTGMINSTEQNLSLDLGIYRLDNVKIGDRVWFDDNKDGVQDAGETGVENVLVTLYDTATAMPVLDDLGNDVTQRTDAAGNYLFDELPPGDYYVVFDFNTLPQNYTATLQDAGGDDGADSDADLTTGATAATGILNSNEEDLSLDLGIHRLDNVEVGDKVWHDENRDGVQDVGEDGVPNVRVMLYDTTTAQPMTGDAGNPLTEVTDANGNYLFIELPPGDYYVVFDLSTLPANHTPTSPDIGNDEVDSDANAQTGQTAPTGMINSNGNDLSLDMGIHRLDNVQVGDRVWYDDNKNGIQDGDETGVADVLATLHDTATGQSAVDKFGVPLVDLTDVDGNYLFDGLPPGDYYVEFQLDTLPTGYVVTQPNQGDDDIVDSDADASTGRTDATGFLPSNSEDLTLDMGIYRPVGVRIGDRVWLDNDQDGIQDGDEPGVPGVIVTLVDSAGNPVTEDQDGNPIVPQVTDEGLNGSGNYFFENLPDGDYAVVFDLSTLPANHAVTKPDQGDDDLLDSDTDPATGETPSTGPLTDGDENLSLDMGIYPLAEVQVGDTVWYDNDNDGLQDVDEPGVFGVIANLFNEDGSPVTDMAGNLVGSEATDANGYYLFENLPPGSYFVEFDLTSLPNSYLPTGQNAGDDDGVDSDADPITGQTAATGKLDYGAQDLTLDMGIVAPVSVGDSVWVDSDNNGLQDAGEPGVPDVTVNIVHVDGSPVTNMTGDPVEPMITDEDGNYLFENLPPGEYVIVFDLSTLPAGYLPTTPNVTSDQQPDASDQLDSDANPATGETSPTGFIPAGQADTSLDMGIVQPAGVRVGDRVWFDDNVNGRQNDGELGVPNVTVHLFNADGTAAIDLDGTPVEPTITDNEGNYLFDSLPAGGYFVQFDLDTLPAGSIVTVQDAGDNDARDSDGDPVTGRTAETDKLAPGQQDLSLDLGIYQPAAIGDLVWEDLDQDGVQDADEPGLPGVKVTLLDGSDTPITTETDENGRYEFTSLLPGKYAVVFTPPAGYEPSPQDTPASDQQPTASNQSDSDADPVTGQTEATALTSGEQDLSWDAGFYMPDVTLPVTVGDRVWFDNNGDGLQGLPADEPGVEGVVAMIFNRDNTPVTDINGNVVQPQKTDGQGNYLFTDLPEGDYFVTFEFDSLPSGYRPTAQNAGDDSTDSDANPKGQTAPTGLLTAGTEDLTLDMGIVAPVTVGDRVWVDSDGDGLQGDPANEPGVPDVTVILLNEDGVPATDINGKPVPSTVTDDNGTYFFDNLPPGAYSVLFDLDTLPVNHVVTKPDVTNDQQPENSDQLDSDADPETGLTAPTGFLIAGMKDSSLDMGLLPLPPVTVGDRVWYDSDRDGIQDAPGDEPGVPGVVVGLFSADGSPAMGLDGNPVGKQKTDENGNYLFTNLVAGSYYAQFDATTLPAGYSITIPNSGDDDSTDSDVSQDSLQTEATSFLPAGSEDLTLDMGIVRDEPVRIGDRVWFDIDRDGIQNAPEKEPGVSGVEVFLFNADGTFVMDMAGNEVGPTKTDEQGNYLFDNLPAGDFVVKFNLGTLPQNYVVTEPNMTNDQADSDANPSNGETGSTGFISNGSEDLTLDMGIVELIPDVRVGDRVWLDENVNGIQDAGEPGVPGVVVALYDALSGEGLEKTETDAQGNYLFDELFPGDYYVQFYLDTIPANHAVVKPDATNDQSPTTSDQTDSDAQPEEGITHATGLLFTGEEDLSLDMGIYQVDSVWVGNRVWYDLNGNGLQDADEPGVEKVTVTLLDAETDEPVAGIAPQQTDSKGEYLFESLPAGSYRVAFDLDTVPVGYGVTVQDTGDDALDSDARPTDGLTHATDKLSGNQGDLTLDMGIVKLAGVTIGDKVWFDNNGDGIQDPTEDGVPGVTVYLYNKQTGDKVTDEAGDPLIQVTDDNGEYLFTGIPPGQYHVLFEIDTLPEGYVVSPADQEPSDTADSDASPTGETPPTGVLLHGDVDRTLDMGIYKPVQVGDRVWFDDGNGLQDEGELGVPNVGVVLYDADSNEGIAKAQTDELGNYLFDNLPPGNYAVEFVLSTLPEGYMLTTTNATNDQQPTASDQLDSDVDASSGRTSETGFLNSGEADLSLDMGITQPVEIGDKVWYDNDRDGIQDEGELGVENVTVVLYDSTGTPVAKTATDSEGIYHFSELLPEDYSIGFSLETLPEGYVVTQANATNNQQPATSDQFDSDPSPDDGRTGSTGFLPSGSTVDNLDMGIHIPVEDLVRVGGQVWEDRDLDDEIGPEEPLLPEIVVLLYSKDDPSEPIAKTVTDEGGNYLFEELMPGDYFTILLPESLPEDAFPPSYYSAGMLDNLRSNSGILDRGDEALELDMALRFPGSLSGVVWLDKDSNGIRLPEEKNLSGTGVLLYDPTGEVVGKMETDANGAYRFDNLIPGNYWVEFVNPESYRISPQFQGSDTTRNSDADPETLQTDAIFVESGAHVPYIDMGLYEGVSIINRLWFDINGDGIQDQGEAGIPSITVYLFNVADEIVDETVTDEEGDYSFGDVPVGEFYVAFAPPDDMSPVVQLGNKGNGFVRGPSITVDGNNNNVSAIDIGFTQPSALGNYVWLDTNKDGLVNAGEVGVADAVVNLLDADGNLLESTTTDSDGRFVFSVIPGDYQLEFVPRDGMEFTLQNQGDDGFDSDVDPETGRTILISISSNMSDFTHYAGLIVSPTAIQLMSLAATESASGVTIEWNTGTELSTFGYEVYRSRDAIFENAVAVTDGLILARGGDEVYTFTDTTVEVGQFYSYWLVEVQNDQQSYHYGPARVMVEGIQTTQLGRLIFLPLVQK